MKSMSQCVNCYILKIVFDWLTDYRFNSEMRNMKGLSGIDAFFIPVNEKCGMKFFKYENVAKYSFHMCRILHHFGAAPRVWDLQYYDLDGDDFKVWGFMMERVETVRSVSHALIKEYYKTVRAKIRELPFVNHDEHEGNVGILNGNPVLIDFGNFSIATEHGSIYMRN